MTTITNWISIHANLGCIAITHTRSEITIAISERRELIRYQKKPRHRRSFASHGSPSAVEQDVVHRYARTFLADA
jgi:hypothetical protein